MGRHLPHNHGGLIGPAANIAATLPTADHHAHRHRHRGAIDELRSDAVLALEIWLLGAQVSERDDL